MNVKFFLRGPFRVEDPEGRDITPSAAKAQGLLLLLATGVGAARGRAFLQDILWSDRGQEQSAGSLRQALAQIKRSFRKNAAVLQADRRRVSLDLDRCLFIQEGHADFAEGLDIRDIEFSNWLSSERARNFNFLTTPGAVTDQSENKSRSMGEPWSIVVDNSEESDAIQNWTTEVMADHAAQSISEVFSVHIDRSDVAPDSGNRWFLKINAVESSKDQMAVRLALTAGTNRRQLWSGHQIVRVNGAPPIQNADVLRLTNEAVEAIGESILDERFRPILTQNPDHLCRSAIRSLFKMTPADVELADEYMRQALEAEPRGLYFAWRAQIRTIQFLERHSLDLTELRKSGEYFSRKAMELERTNSMVLAMVANTKVFLTKDLDGAYELASLSAQINPANPMAWWALSTAKLYCGDAKGAYKCSRRARDLAKLSPNRFWWDLQQFASALMLGRLEEAKSLMQSAAALCPNFRPPLRYLIALQAQSGNEEEADAAARKLTELEADFSVERLVSDRSYPASLLHRAPGLNLDKLAGLL